MGSRHRHERDGRTAQQKWDQMMSEAYFRGYLHDPRYRLHRDLVGEWDHTKRHGIRHYKSAEESSAFGLRSKGTIPVGIRDDTPEIFVFRVTTFPPILADQQGEPTLRIIEMPGLEAGVQKPYTEMDIRKREDDMVGKREQILTKRDKSPKILRDGFLDKLREDGGPRWREWCHLDEYLWNRYGVHQHRDFYPVITGSMVGETLSEEGYRRAREQMEILASDQGTQSYTELIRDHPHEELKALKKRYFNYLEKISYKPLETKQNAPWPSPEETFEVTWNRLNERKCEAYWLGQGTGPHKTDLAKVQRNYEALPEFRIDELFRVLDREWVNWRREMSDMVAKHRDEQRLKSMSSKLRCGSLSQQVPATVHQSQGEPQPDIGQASSSSSQPVPKVRHQNSGLGSIGSGRPSKALGAAPGYKQIWNNKY